MKRLVIMLAVSLLFGAVVNIAVAWILVLTVHAPVAGGTLIGTQSSMAPWPASVPSTWPADATYRLDSTRVGLCWLIATAEVPSFTPGKASETVSIIVLQAGFPLRSVKLESRSWWSGTYCPPNAGTLLYGIGEGVRVPGWLLLLAPTQQAMLPIVPMPFPFALNTLFYAGLSYFALSGFGDLRRFLRLRAGRCPACKYPIGASPVCTECGTRIPAQRRIT